MKMRRFMAMLVTALLLIGVLSTSVFAAPKAETLTDTAGNYFISDEDTMVQKGHFFGIFGTGKNVTVGSTISDDDMVLVGANIQLKSTVVGSSVYTAGYELTIDGSEIKGNLAAAGYTIAVDKNTVANSVLLAAREVEFSGKAKAASIAAEKVVLNGQIEGDVRIDADELVIGENAVVTGKLMVKAVNEPVIPKTAQIGKVDFTKIEKEIPKELTWKEKAIAHVKSCLYWIIAMVILGLALCLLFPRQLAESGKMFKSRPLGVLLTGILTGVAAPIIGALFCVTVFGAPLGIAILIIYALLLAICVTFTAASLGKTLLPKVPTVIPTVILVALFEIIRHIPIAGAILFAICAIYTLGTIWLITWGNRAGKRRKKAEEIVDMDDDDDNDNGDDGNDDGFASPKPPVYPANETLEIEKIEEVIPETDITVENNVEKMEESENIVVELYNDDTDIEE